MSSPFPRIPRDLSRRTFLQRSGCGFGAAALSALMQLDAGAARRSLEPTVDPVNPLLPRAPHFAPKAKSVIFLFMVGGPSSLDTFDYKPTLQKLNGHPMPDSIREGILNSRFFNAATTADPHLMASPYSFRQYGQSGAWVSELFPNMARHVDDLCFIHSMQAESNNHAPASIQLHTGETIGGKASLGSWVTYGLGTENQNLPGYVLLFETGPQGGGTNFSNGFLPAAFQGTRLRSQGQIVRDLSPPNEFAGSQRRTLDALREMNLLHRDQHPGFGELDARIASYELAYRMQSEALEVGDLEKEPAHIRAAYGIDSPSVEKSKFARKCLLARRLVQRGVRFVQLYDMYDKDGWDAHMHLKGNHDEHAAVVDQPIGALLDDLKQSGMLEETLVIWASEFGRTPMKEAYFGRQHNSAGFTLWMAGGGVRPGFHLGATDEIGLMAVDRPVQFRDLHATILATLGIDHEQLMYEQNGRLERLTGVQNNARVIHEVLSDEIGATLAQK